MTDMWNTSYNFSTVITIYASPTRCYRNFHTCSTKQVLNTALLDINIRHTDHAAATGPWEQCNAA